MYRVNLIGETKKSGNETEGTRKKKKKKRRLSERKNNAFVFLKGYAIRVTTESHDQKYSIREKIRHQVFVPVSKSGSVRI